MARRFFFGGAGSRGPRKGERDREAASGGGAGSGQVPHRGSSAPADTQDAHGEPANGEPAEVEASLTPTRPSSRLEVIDGLRGFAILLILTANLPIFISPALWGAPAENSAAASGVFGRGYEFLVAFVSEGKFITALAFLLGLGLVLQVGRSARSGRSPTRFLVRRLAVLGVIGLCHALLVWSGDVLLFYAVLGLPFLLFVGRPAATLVKWSAGILAVLLLGGMLISGSVALAAFSGEASSSGQASAASEADPGFVSDLVGEAYGADGSYADQVLARAAKAPFNLFGGLLFSGPMVFSMMLLGAAAGNSGAAQRLASYPREEDPKRTLRRVAVAGIGVGLPLNLFYAVVWELPALMPAAYDQALLILSGAMWMVGAPALALGWMALLVLVLARYASFGGAASGGAVGGAASGVGPWLGTRLAAVGRMALTNYLAQSVILTGLLYGSGLYGEISYGWAVLVMVAIWAAELVGSKPYLERFGFGPVEWAWRKLSYGGQPPAKR